MQSLFTPHRYALDQIDGPHTQTAGLLYEGDEFDNSQNGTGGDDGFDYSQGGNDTLNGLGGNDEFYFGAAYNGQDHVDGGDGYDRLILDGNYATSPFTELSTASLQNVEEIDFKTGHSYNIFMGETNVKAGEHLVFDATTLKAKNGLFIDGESETDGAYTIYGGKGKDQFLLGDGSANAYGGGGNDFISVHASHVDNKLVTGNGGTDTLELRYFQAESPTIDSNLSGFETLWLTNGGGLVDITATVHMADAALAAGALLHVLPHDYFGTDSSVFFDGASELDGRFDVTGTVGSDTFTGGQKNDAFHIEKGGNDFVLGQGGDDTIFAGAAYDSNDNINGEGGKDTLVLDSGYSGSPQLMTFTNIEILKLTNGSSYNVAFADSVVAAGARLTVNGSGLKGTNGIAADGSAETDGTFTMTGGAGNDGFMGGAKNDILTGNGGNDFIFGGSGNDTISGGAGNDVLIGLGGADTVTPDDGKDTIACGEVAQSTGKTFDTVDGFDFDNADIFAIGSVSGINNKITGGALSNGNFNGDLAAAVTAAKLGVHHAVLFTPSGTGPYAGDTFLIVDINGQAGYQANQDFVFMLKNSLHLDHLSASDFNVPN